MVTGRLKVARPLTSLVGLPSPVHSTEFVNGLIRECLEIIRCHTMYTRTYYFYI